MQIIATYDPSVANAPAGFKQAVNAAIQYFDTTISNNITVNISFGWGEVNGQTLGSGDLGESVSNYFTGFTYNQVVSALANADGNSPGASAAIAGLPASDPTNGGDFGINSAELKALSLTSGVTMPAVDGYVGLSATANFTFDPNNRSVSGAYDAIGVLEHEISEVLGRSVSTSQRSAGSIQESPLDLFRYSSADIHSYTQGAAYFSLNGDQLLQQFNNGGNGGDGGDWASVGAVDSFDAFSKAGVENPISTVDLRVLELLGYNISPTATTPNGTTPTVPLLPALILTQTGGLAAGQTANYNGQAAILFSPTSVTAGPNYTNAGTITNSGVDSQVDVIGVGYDPNDTVSIDPSAPSNFANTATGVLTVDAVTTASDAVGVYYGPNTVSNAGLIQVSSATADAWGVVGAGFTNAAGATLTVQADDHAVGADLTYAPPGASLANAGAIQASGLHAYGVQFTANLANSGSLVATGSGSGSTGIGVYEANALANTIVNSGSISVTAQSSAYGIDEDLAGVFSITNSGTLTASASSADGILLSLAGSGADVVTNSGTINASTAIAAQLAAGTSSSASLAINNTGVINGAINLSGLPSGVSVHLTDKGSISGTVTLGGGSDTLTFDPSGGASSIVVADFQAGSGGDVLDLAAYLDSTLQGYTAGSDPFTEGFLRVLQSGSNTLVQIDPAGASGGSFSTLVTLQGLNAVTLTASNLDGFASNLTPDNTQTAPAGANVLLAGGPGNDLLIGANGANDTLQGGGGSNILEGGTGGVNTALYTGLYRGYTVGANTSGPDTVAGGLEGASDTLTNIARIQFADGYLAVSPTDTAGEVYRVYEATLGRAPDPVGLANWVDLLNSGTDTLQQVVNGFVGSTEFQSLYGALSNTQFVTLLYENVLGRAPDAQGLASWVGLLKNGTDTQAQVVLGFTQSTEDITNTAAAVEHGLWVMDPNAAAVARLYDTVLGRLPDQAGEISWTQILDSGSETLLQVTQGFVASAEFQANYGSLNNTLFVTQLYENTLHRAPDPTGLANWVGLLNAGTDTRAQVVLGFSESPEHVAEMAPYINQGIWFV